MSLSSVDIICDVMSLAFFIKYKNQGYVKALTTEVNGANLKAVMRSNFLKALTVHGPTM